MLFYLLNMKQKKLKNILEKVCIIKTFAVSLYR
nr:MAG TPA: hypothetical protein [Caudoviricetes sp.]